MLIDVPRLRRMDLSITRKISGWIPGSSIPHVQVSLALDQDNWLAYMKYEAMFERSDVNGDGKPGGGGEYEVQLGFGWTNGVALQLLDQYGVTLTSGCRLMSSGLLLPLVISAALMLQ
ncbi:Trehalase [Liparis tanakae]|uniref:Trehalase n=1 Tax=Liparis tanakae TaxID=230148 RepID=A0A4Z2HLC2_9TELE|nr:Trehalase [Liparis tanakae]